MSTPTTSTGLEPGRRLFERFYMNRVRGWDSLDSWQKAEWALAEARERIDNTTEAGE